MNKLPLFIATALLVASGLASIAAMAGEQCNHNHHAGVDSAITAEPVNADPINAEQAQQVAVLRIADLVKSQAIDSSWAEVKPASRLTDYTDQDAKQQKHWQVSFINPAIKNPQQQTLYVLLTVDGRFKSTNYTGR